MHGSKRRDRPGAEREAKHGTAVDPGSKRSAQGAGMCRGAQRAAKRPERSGARSSPVPRSGSPSETTG